MTHGNGLVKVWSSHDGRLVKEFPPGISPPRFSPDGRWLATGHDRLRFWEVGTWGQKPRPGSDDGPADGFPFFSPDGTLIGLVRDGPVRLIEPATGSRGRAARRPLTRDPPLDRLQPRRDLARRAGRLPVDPRLGPPGRPPGAGRDRPRLGPPALSAGGGATNRAAQDREIDPGSGPVGPPQEPGGAQADQDLGHPPAEAVGVVERAGRRGGDPLPAVGVEHGGVEGEQAPSTSRAKAARGIMQPPSSSARTRRSATHRAMGRRVVQRGEQGERRRVVGPALDPQGPLPDRRQEPRRAEPLGDVPVQARAGAGPPRPGPRRRARRSRALFSRVSTFPRTPDDRSGRAGRGAAAPAGGASRCRPSPRGAGRRGSGAPGRSGRRPRPRGAGRRPGSGRRGRCVGRSFRLWTATSTEPVGQGPLDLLGEQPGPADRGQRRVPVAVALGLDLDQLDRQARVERPEPVGDPARLPAGQVAPPGPDPDRPAPPSTRPSASRLPLRPADHDDHDPRRPGPLQGPGRRPGGRAGGQDVVDQQDRPPLEAAAPAGPGTPPASASPARPGRARPGAASPTTRRSAGRTSERQSRRASPSARASAWLYPRPSRRRQCSGTGTTQRRRPSASSPERLGPPLDQELGQPPGHPGVPLVLEAQAEVADRPLIRPQRDRPRRTRAAGPGTPSSRPSRSANGPDRHRAPGAGRPGGLEQFGPAIRAERRPAGRRRRRPGRSAGNSQGVDGLARQLPAAPDQPAGRGERPRRSAPERAVTSPSGRSSGRARAARGGGSGPGPGAT